MLTFSAAPDQDALLYQRHTYRYIVEENAAKAVEYGKNRVPEELTYFKEMRYTFCVYLVPDLLMARIRMEPTGEWLPPLDLDKQAKMGDEAYVAMCLAESQIRQATATLPYESSRTAAYTFYREQPEAWQKEVEELYA